jgi:hypothetical protein
VGRRAPQRSPAPTETPTQLPAPRSGAGEPSAFRTLCQRQLPAPEKPNCEERRLCARKPGHAKRVIGPRRKNLLTPYPTCLSLHFSQSRATHLRAQTCRSLPYVEAHFIAVPHLIRHLEFGIWNSPMHLPHTLHRALFTLSPRPHHTLHRTHPFTPSPRLITPFIAHPFTLLTSPLHRVAMVVHSGGLSRQRRPRNTRPIPPHHAVVQVNNPNPSLLPS